MCQNSLLRFVRYLAAFAVSAFLPALVSCGSLRTTSCCSPPPTASTDASGRHGVGCGPSPAGKKGKTMPIKKRRFAHPARLCLAKCLFFQVFYVPLRGPRCRASAAGYAGGTVWFASLTGRAVDILKSVYRRSFLTP